MNKALLILPVFALLTACQFETSNGTATPAPVVPQSQDQGNSSGGGGFGDESSMQLLKWSQQIVTRALRQSNPAVFKGLPQGWTAERFAKLVESVRPEPNKVVSRYDRELMFDYVIPKDGEPYLIATSLFFRAFASVPVTAMTPQALEPYLREVRNRLLHEAAHVFGIGTSEKSDYKARVFANYVTNIFWQNNVICKADVVPENYPNKVEDWDVEETIKKWAADGTPAEEVTKLRQEVQQSPFIWVVNRPLGFGLQMRKFFEKIQRRDFFVDTLSAGKPTMGTRFAYFPQQLKAKEEMSELSRYYEPAFFNSDSQRVNQQYYKLAEVNNGWMALKGLYEQKPSSTSPSVTPCDSSETIRIPQSLSGIYAGTVEYNDTCNTAWGRNSVPERVTGKIAVSCTESFQPIEKFDQFLGEQAFTDPDLISIIPDDSID